MSFRLALLQYSFCFIYVNHAPFKSGHNIFTVKALLGFSNLLRYYYGL